MGFCPACRCTMARNRNSIRQWTRHSARRCPALFCLCKSGKNRRADPLRRRHIQSALQTALLRQGPRFAIRYGFCGRHNAKLESGVRAKSRQLRPFWLGRFSRIWRSRPKFERRLCHEPAKQYPLGRPSLQTPIREPLRLFIARPRPNKHKNKASVPPF